MSKDDMEMFGVTDLETSFDGCRSAIGIRNANNKRFRLSCTVGLRVFVCHNLAFQGDYSPVLAKHSKNFSLEDSLSIGVDRMQRNSTNSTSLRSTRSLNPEPSNASTSAFKELDPIPQFRATAQLGRFLEAASTA